jgi:hypothetical protein
MVGVRDEPDDVFLKKELTVAFHLRHANSSVMDLRNVPKRPHTQDRLDIQCFYSAVRNLNDRRSCFGMGGNVGPDPTMERLHMPSGDATLPCKGK